MLAMPDIAVVKGDLWQQVEKSLVLLYFFRGVFAVCMYLYFEYPLCHLGIVGAIFKKPVFRELYMVYDMMSLSTRFQPLSAESHYQSDEAPTAFVYVQEVRR